MKKLMVVGILLASFVVLFQLGGNGYAAQKWKLYDNFNSGVINEDKWYIDDSSAIITIEDGKAKFEHLLDSANDSAWLSISEHPERITGIKATVTIVSAEDSLRARVGGWIGAYGEDGDDVWGQTTVQTRPEEAGGDRLFGAASVLDRYSNWDTMYDLNYSSLLYPVEVIGQTFTIEMYFDKRGYGYGVEGMGDGKYNPFGGLGKGVVLHMGIGTRSDNEFGTGVVYFDDVYVLKGKPKDRVKPKVKNTSPKNRAKNVDVNTQLIVKFTEPMQPWFFGGEDPDYNVPEGTTWAYEYPQTFIWTFGSPFGPGEWVEMEIKEGWFQDPAGNPNKPYSFRFKTQAFE